MIKEMEAKEELQRQARTFPYVFFGQGCRVRGTREIIYGSMLFLSTRGQKVLEFSSMELGKVSLVRVQEVSFF